MTETPILHGYRVVMTRPTSSNTAFSLRIRALGAELIQYPVMQLDSLPIPSQLRHQEALFTGFDCVTWTSQNAVRHVFEQLTQAQQEATVKHFDGLHACIGTRTAHALEEWGIKPDIWPAKARAQELAQHLIQTYPISGWRILFPCSAWARSELPEGLRAAGGVVESCPVYTPSPTHPDPEVIHQGITEQKPQIIVFASPSAVRYFVENVGHHALQMETRRIWFACIGSTTATALQTLGYTPDIVPANPGMPQLLHAIQSYFSLNKRKQ